MPNLLLVNFFKCISRLLTQRNKFYWEMTFEIIDESFENTNDSNFYCFIWLIETMMRKEMSLNKMIFMFGKKMSINIKRNLVHLIHPFLDLVTFICHFISCFCSKNGNTCKSSSNMKFYCKDFYFQTIYVIILEGYNLHKLKKRTTFDDLHN